jgi:plasmid stabilization system protein ParE
MLSFRVLQEARRELLEAARWYRAEEDAELARAFATEYRAQLARARQLPNSGIPLGAMPPDIHLDVRSFLFARFPYKLVIAASSNQLIVLAVAHQRRRPFYWITRLEAVVR